MIKIRVASVHTRTLGICRLLIPTHTITKRGGRPHKLKATALSTLAVWEMQWFKAPYEKTCSSYEWCTINIRYGWAYFIIFKFILHNECKITLPSIN